MNTIIAYTVGSFWFCIEHGSHLVGAEPVMLDNTHNCYDYSCEECGLVIKKRSIN